jgi:SAM-dependent methyltransferase
MGYQAPDYPKLLAEAGRILRRGGVLLAADPARQYVHDENFYVDLSEYLPVAQRYQASFWRLLQADGLTWSGDTISNMIENEASLKLLDSIIVAVRVIKYSIFLSLTMQLTASHW